MVTKLTLEYDGGEFAGWARQPGLRTVQEEVERALRTILGEHGADGEPLALTVAGRTDRGVHAWRQVASYAHEAVDPTRLNTLLPSDVAVLASEPAPDTFDARRDARSRTYCYRVLARRARGVFMRERALWWPQPINREALDACACILLGSHDFTAFTPTETDHVRFERDVLWAEWRSRSTYADVWPERADVSPERADVSPERADVWPERADVSPERADVWPERARKRSFADGEPPLGSPFAEEGLLEFWIEADTFMRHMNRVLVGTMLEVAAGRRTVEEFTRLLEGRPRPDAGPTAPAHGLALASVAYR